MWMFTSIENFGYWIGTLFEKGLGNLGEKAGDKVPSGRRVDIKQTKRIVKGDMAELHTLYTKLLAYEPQAEQTCSILCSRSVREALEGTPVEFTSPVGHAALTLCQGILVYEGYYPIPKIDFARQLPLKEIWELTDSVRSQLAFYENPKTQEKIAEAFRVVVNNLLPDAAIGDEEALSLVSFIDLLPDAADKLEGLIQYTVQLAGENRKGLLRNLAKRMVDNVLLISGIDPALEEQSISTNSLMLPTALKGKMPRELVGLYLTQSPFTTFFNTPLPFSIPRKTRFSHTHILGGSGHGKTQLMQNHILADLPLIREGKASVIVIDSQGDMFRNIAHLEKVGEIADRVILIDPNELDDPPALNLFDFGLERADRYSPLEREMLYNGAVSLYKYIFGAVLGSELTAKQGVIFGYLAHLMMVVPDATIDTLMDFMEEPDSVRPYLAKLNDPVTKRFFDRQFFHTTFNETRQQILYRLFDVLGTRALARMFRNKRNKLNIFEAMNRGSLILINTAKDLLKQEGTEILGRFFIALIAQAAQERASIPDERRMPTFVYIDEAHDYFDESMETLLEQARKYGVGLVIAHQHLGQFPSQLEETVRANTAIKLVGGLSSSDATELAKDMRCTREFLLGMKKQELAKKTEFACFVRDLTGHPLSVTIPLGAYDSLPKLTTHAFNSLIAQNRFRVCESGHEPDDPPPPSNGSHPDTPEFL
jgi:hypothetical protein